jgi:lysophospholipase L1-like esterase
MSANAHVRRRSYWKEFSLLLASIALSIIILEVYLRETSPHIIRKTSVGISGQTVAGDYTFFMDTLSGRRLIPNTHVVYASKNGEIPIDINSDGFRGDDIPGTKASNELRILVLGDSITLGSGVLNEKTYVQIAQKQITSDKSTRSVRLINAGIDGLKILPDIVVVGFYLNDGNPPDRLAAGLANPNIIRRHSVLAQTIYRYYKFRQYMNGTMREADMYGWVYTPSPPDWRTNRDSFLHLAETAELDWGAAWKAPTWIKIEEQMKRLKLLTKEHNIEVIFIVFPVAFQVYSEFVEDAPQQRIIAMSKKYDFSCYDLLPLFRAQKSESRSLFLDWCHLTETGHELVGDVLAVYLSSYIRQKHLVPIELVR